MAHDKIPAGPKNAFADDVALMYTPFKTYVSQVVPLIFEHMWSNSGSRRPVSSLAS